MKKLGLITIGQSPRTDITPDLEPILGPDVQLCQAGALDGITPQEAAALAPEEGDSVLISKLRDGSTVLLGEQRILPRLQQCIYSLEEQEAELILFLCTGSFPPFQSHVPLIYPCVVLNGAVPALTGRSRIAVVAPKEEQRAQCMEKWQNFVQSVQVVCASPYGPPEELDQAAREASALDADLIVMDCMGYTTAMKERVRQLSGKPVVLSRTLAARAVAELLA
ncbi:MAG: AroM family protein [Lawsonibacter sp.]|nr:AroM family protein [Lawsonibacter sp.]